MFTVVPVSHPPTFITSSIVTKPQHRDGAKKSWPRQYTNCITITIPLTCLVLQHPVSYVLYFPSCALDSCSTSAKPRVTIGRLTKLIPSHLSHINWGNWMKLPNLIPNLGWRHSQSQPYPLVLLDVASLLRGPPMSLLRLGHLFRPCLLEDTIGCGSPLTRTLGLIGWRLSTGLIVLRMWKLSKEKDHRSLLTMMSM